MYRLRIYHILTGARIVDSVPYPLHLDQVHHQASERHVPLVEHGFRIVVGDGRVHEWVAPYEVEDRVGQCLSVVDAEPGPGFGDFGGEHGQPGGGGGGLFFELAGEHLLDGGQAVAADGRAQEAVAPVREGNNSGVT